MHVCVCVHVARLLVCVQQDLLLVHIHVAITLYTVTSVIAGILCLLLPIETKGREMTVSCIHLLFSIILSVIFIFRAASLYIFRRAVASLKKCYVYTLSVCFFVNLSCSVFINADVSFCSVRARISNSCCQCIIRCISCVDRKYIRWLAGTMPTSRRIEAAAGRWIFIIVVKCTKLQFIRTLTATVITHRKQLNHKKLMLPTITLTKAHITIAIRLRDDYDEKGKTDMFIFCLRRIGSRRARYVVVGS